jgi:Flp pilus assembly pilin Flp
MRTLLTRTLREFLKDESGQDLIEYTLLLGVMGLSAALIFVNAGVSTKTVWTDAKNVLSNAAVASS